MIINVSILWFLLWGWGDMLIFNYTSVISSWISYLLIWTCYRYCDSAYGDWVTYRYSMITDWFLSWSKRYHTPRSHSAGHADRVLQRNHGCLTWWKSCNQSAYRWTAIMTIQMCPAMSIRLLWARVLSTHSMAWMVLMGRARGIRLLRAMVLRTFH